MKMRSFQVCQCGAPLQANEQEAPKPQGTQVLLKMLAAGVCHSDLHIWDGYYEIGGGKKLMLADRGIKLPLTMGHENVGEVVAIGPDAKGVKIGDVRLVKYQDDYVTLLMHMKRYEEAEAVAREALASLPAAEETSRQKVLNSLVTLYEQWEKLPQAEHYRKMLTPTSAPAATQPAKALVN